MQIKNGYQKFYDPNTLNISSKETLIPYKKINKQYPFDFIENKFLNTTFLIRKALRSRNKRTLDDKTLVEATIKGQYTYWLSQEDIADIARLEYNHYRGIGENNAAFEVLGSITQLYYTTETFQLKIHANPQLEKARLTLIINLENFHWVTLVIDYQEKGFYGYYVDSKNNPIPSHYYRTLIDSFYIQVVSVSPGFIQQQDSYNCGLWALENANNINRMLDQKQPMLWLVNQLRQRHNREYFDARRVSFAEKLRSDPMWNERHPSFLQHLNAQKKPLQVDDISSTLENAQPDSKRFKAIDSEKEKLTSLLETFVETFISTFIKKLSIYHLLAKDEQLTVEALKAELKTGITGALLGMSISQTFAGSIPSLVASLRTISSKYYLSKTKAQKITKFFSELKPKDFSSILSEAAVNIFCCFESQFMQVTDKAGNRVAIEKLAEDAVDRMLNAIEKHSESMNKLITTKMIEKSVLQGPSEKFFVPNIKQGQLRISGYTIQNKDGKTINTANLYEKIGLVVLQSNKFYVFKKSPSNPYGYRRLFDWEKEVNGELKESLKEQYIEKLFFQTENSFQVNSRKYDYVLDPEKNQAEAQRILDKFESQYPVKYNRKYENKKSIYFNLIKPVKNFSGRSEILETLHRTLISDRTTAIVPAWSFLSIDSFSNSLSLSDSDSSQASSGSQLSISGLGGIGKTQLALRYAELYAYDYDHNVLWINAETQENLAFSFYQLATKLQIATLDRYKRERNSEEIAEDVYEYFSDRKSLFIFDNVENYRALEIYLPKARPGNKPTLLITSRYNNWGNVASILPLTIFTTQETEELIKKSLDLPDDIYYERIKELNELLQGLPLALQQALAYIKLRRSTDANFSLHHYIELYKEKNKELLNFNFSDYSNDSYLKTVFTTWLITLDKIQSYPLGKDAAIILNIMAYLYPDNISVTKFYHLNLIYHDFKVDNLDAIIHLLSSYSMINPRENQNHYTIHRLVQQVLRLNLEKNQAQFEEIVDKTQRLLWHWSFVFKKDAETKLHNLHFLLYMVEHKDTIPSLLYGHPEKILFDNLLLQNAKYCSYFIDLAYLKFPKEKFLKFMGNAIAYYIKLGSVSYLSEILNFLEKKQLLGIFSKENIKYITEYSENIKNTIFKLRQYSTSSAKKENQKRSIYFYYKFKVKIFGENYLLPGGCIPHSQKRSICTSEVDQSESKALKNQHINSHLKKIGQVSRYINSALMTKDILSALIQGEFAEVAINFVLIQSSILSGKVSNSMLVKGQNLVADANLLEKNLGLENKKAFNILFNEEVLSIGKKQFLGKAMQIASSYVKKLTSVFFIYNLSKEIQAYKMGDQTVLPNMVSNSIILGVDGIEIGIEGAEFLEIIIGVSAFTGPIGEWVALLAWIGAEGYAGRQRIEAIEKYVHLSRGEQFIEFLRSLVKMSPSEYLQVKVNNAQLVERAINFLKNNTDIKSYIFPSFYTESALYENSNVFLDQKREFTPDDTNPDPLNEGHLFCSSGFCTTSGVNVKKYVCNNALGVEYLFNRTGNATLIDLEQGKDEVIAFSHSPTLFLVQNGEKWYTGGDKGNIFNLQGDSIAGFLEGGNGSDILVLDNFHPRNSDYLLLDNFGFLCGQNYRSMSYIPPFCSPDEIRIQTLKIDQIYGRKNEPDIFYLNQYTHIIDGYGGRNSEQSDSFFITDRSPENLKFTLRNNTSILFFSNITGGSTDYIIPSNEVGESRIQYYITESVQHRFFFEVSFQNIDAITVKNNTINISVLTHNAIDKKIFTITITGDSKISNNNQTSNATNFSKHIYYSFKDIEIKSIHNEHLYGKEIITNNKTIDEKISLFRTLANRLKKTLSIQLINNITLSIGREEKHEIFYINSLFESHLVGNGGENAYILLPGNETAFPLPNITLYETSKDSNLNGLEELINSLDLREIVKQYKQIYPNAIISSHVASTENDLILTLSNSVYSPSHPNFYDFASFYPWATIQLKNALFSHWYQKLDIFLDSSPKNIAPLDEEFWTLKRKPLFFTDDKKIIVITNRDIEEGSEVILLRNMGNFSFLKAEEDLILTNALVPLIDYCTIICYQFYQLTEMKKKILSTTFSFFDQTIRPQDYLGEINQATHFSYFSKLVSNASNPVSSVYLNSITILTHHNQMKLALRHKRQANFNEKIIENTPSKLVFPNKKLNYSQSARAYEEERILAIADDYLKKYDATKNKAPYHKKNNSPKKNKNRKNRSFISAQEKTTPKIQKHHSFNHQNNNDFKRTHLNSDRNKLKLLTNSKTKNPLQVAFFHKPETTKPKKISLGDFNSDKKINSFIAIKPSYHQEKIQSTTNTKAISNYPANTQNQSRSKTSKLYSVSSHIEPINLHSTLMFFELIARKTLRNPIKPVSFDKKLNKTIEKVKKQEDRIKSKIFGIQKLY